MFDVLIVLSTFSESGGYSGDESAGEREVWTFLMAVMAGDAFGWVEVLAVVGVAICCLIAFYAIPEACC